MGELRRTRILVLIKGLGIGGAERLIVEGAAHWDRHQFDYKVAYLLPWKDQLVPRLHAAGIPTECLGGRRGWGPATPVRLRRLVRDWAPDLIHAHSPVTGILARLTTSLPCVYSEHNLVDSYREPTRTLNRLTYGRNRAVVAVSEAVARSIAGYPGPVPRVIPNGVSPVVALDMVNRTRVELGVDWGRPLVVHVGNIRPYKGQDNLIAAAVILKGLSPDVSIVSVGGEKHRGDMDRMVALAEQRGVGDTIRFLGRRADAERYLAAADVVVNPSQVEGLPLTVLEALALARPVVATDVGGVGTVVIHERTGLLVPPDDPKALAEAIHRALIDPDAKMWGEAGAELIARDHGIAEMVRGYEQIYRELLA